jgi:hypothetical protein
MVPKKDTNFGKYCFTEKSNTNLYINYNDNIISINELPSNINDLSDIIKTNYSINDFYILHNNKLLTDINGIKKDDTIEIYNRLNGGNPLNKLLDKSFGPILDPLKKMLVGIVDIAILIGEVFALIPKIIQIAINIFKPDKLLNDVIYGTTIGINNMISALMNKLSFSTEKTMDEKDADGTGGIFGIDDTNKSVCIKPTLINLIILVLCPPLSLYIHLGSGGINGITGFFYIIFMVIICCGMTYYMYYFPGFLFAALHVLC